MCLAQQSLSSDASQKTAEPRHFVFTDAGSGRTGGHSSRYISFHNFEAADGVLVQRSVESYNSPEQASDRLKNLTSHASRVIDRGVKKTEDGKLIGKRIVILTRDWNKKLVNIVAWTDGANVYVLRSQSLPHVLDFEQQFYPLPANNQHP
jgi:hypothetical protein